MKNTKFNIWIPLLFSIAMIIGMFLGYRMRDNMPGRNFFSTDKRRPLQEIMDLVESKYVDDIKVDSLADTAIQAILAKLDPHSVYIPADELQDVNEDMEGLFFGIGIEFNILNDTLNVVHVLKDGPSFKAGIEIGDKFIKVDDSGVTGKSFDGEKARKYLRGNRGSKVNITFLRDKATKQVTVTRDAIPLKSVDATYMIDKTIGYIRLNKFSQTTYKEFMVALTDLNKQGMQTLILDLRDNGGGVLDEAIEIADEFLEGDKLITYTEGKHIPKKDYRCRRTGQFEKGKLVVLADENTASASEVLLGALQDWDRATIVGRRTFGKGLVQDQYDLSDGSAVRLTIARYYTPIGRSIQRKYDAGGKAYYEEITNRYKNGEVYTDSTKEAKGKQFKTQGGKIVYDGGGISPDYFVAVDTIGYSKASAHIFSSGVINDYVYQYYLSNKAQLKNYKTIQDFKAGLTLSEKDWQNFTALAAKDSINLQKITPKEKLKITSVLKAAVARLIWRTEGYYEVMNVEDAGLKKALEVVR
jgi:carboxyl-terminal processing protease